MRKILLLSPLLLFLYTHVSGQGITTATISGIIVDQNSEPLPGANILAVHTPSGSEYGTSSRPDGRFTIVNARVGGPYVVTVSFVGYESQVRENVQLSLGNTTTLEFKLAESGTQLEELVVTSSSVFNAERTGAASNISNRTIQSVPTITRGLRDFTKISPLANTSGNGTSFAGANNRYNQFAIDGLVNNDVFGLAASGTNGGQTGIEPISLDAIEEFQINVAPYDVRQGGFTGGGINAVTRSGSNKFQGSVYFFGNNQNLVGDVNPNTDVKLKYPEYKDYQAGIRLGGPIIKNKVFFFVNGEITRSKTPLGFQPGTGESNISIDEVNRVVNTLETIAPDFNPGAYLGIADELNSNKWLAKVDWNINKNHKLTIRHSYTYGENIDNSRSSNQLRFYDNGVYFPSTTNSTGIELNSVFGDDISNRLLVGRTTVRDDRDPLGTPFPYTLINLTNGRSIIFGSENSSVANQLDQDNYTITDNLTFFRGQHTITLGTHNEFYKFYNLFVQNIYGNYAFRSLEDFESQAGATPVAPTFYRVGYSFKEDGPLQTEGGSSFNAFQFGLYAQDEWQATDRLKVTAGLRIDIPVFPDKPEGNEAFNTAYGEQGLTGTVPDSKILWSPRLGFNLDAFGNKDLQVRGGIGLFTGRVPFVWVSNQYSNNGQLNGTYSTGNSSSSGTPLTNGIGYVTDPHAQPLPGQVPIASVTPGRGAINIIDPDFRFPQVFRTNLAVDKALPWGLTATVEGIFSKTYNNVNFVNLNRVEQTNFTFAGADTRPRYTTTSTSPTASGYTSAGRIDPNFEEIVKLENTNEGYSYNVVFQLQKNFDKGFSGSLAYTYGESKDLNSGTSSVAYSNWQFVNNVNGLNSLPLTRSNYSLGSRIVGLVSYRKEYTIGATQISLFYNGQSGQPFSYRYNGDLNFDGTQNDLIYVPAQASDINLVSYTITVDGSPVTVTPEEQWAALDAFIERDDYLSSRRGNYAERNGARTPFQHQFDLRLMQEFLVQTGNISNRLQLTLDVMNVGNLVNSDWGRQYTLANQEFALVNFLGLRDDDPSASTVDYSANVPRFTYNAGGQTNGKAWAANDFFSRWRMQIGLRYIFN
jgi:outer membrane receptor for ferrienterochelin and colicin